MRLYEECEPVPGRRTRGKRPAADLESRQKCTQGRPGSKRIRLACDPGYYFKSTVFWLLAPICMVKILQRRLTDVDLGLEPRLHLQYQLLKRLHQSFTDEFALKGFAGNGPFSFCACLLF